MTYNNLAFNGLIKIPEKVLELVKFYENCDKGGLFIYSAYYDLELESHLRLIIALTMSQLSLY